MWLHGCCPSKAPARATHLKQDFITLHPCSPPMTPHGKYPDLAIECKRSLVRGHQPFCHSYPFILLCRSLVSTYHWCHLHAQPEMLSIPPITTCCLPNWVSPTPVTKLSLPTLAAMVTPSLVFPPHSGLWFTLQLLGTEDSLSSPPSYDWHKPRHAVQVPRVHLWTPVECTARLQWQGDFHSNQQVRGGHTWAPSDGKGPMGNTHA